MGFCRLSDAREKKDEKGGKKEEEKPISHTQKEWFQLATSTFYGCLVVDDELLPLHHRVSEAAKGTGNQHKQY